MGKEVKVLLFLGVVSLRVCFASSSVDEDSLLSMKAYINSDILATNWSKETSFCTWTGIVCGKKHPERVTGLNLSNMGLHGTIAKEIGNLTFLRFVDISNNSINGLIPGEIGRLRRLRVLKMAFNQLSDSIPNSIGLLRKLQGLNLSNNYLSGNIPTSLSACDELKMFDLSHNNLGGDVPAGFGNWSQLQEFSLRSNYLIEYGSQGLISTMVDVYSYGILLMEMLSRRKPTDEMFSGDLTMRRWVCESFPDSVLQIVDNELLNTDDDEVRATQERCLTLAMGLALECTADLPEERPNMRDVLTAIGEIKVKLHSRSNMYDRFLRSSEERDVGVGYGVSAQYFLDIENVNVDFEEHHINAYLAIPHSYLGFSLVREPRARVAIVDTMFSVNVQEIWMAHHGDDAPDTAYDNESIEDLSYDELQFLLQYVRGERPTWGNFTDWLEYDEVIVVCNFSGHWVVCKLNLISCTISMFDSIQHRFTNNIREQREVDTRPLARIVPVLLMHAGFWEHRVHLPRLTQWPVQMMNRFVQTDSHSCGPFAMMCVEAILSGRMSPDGAQYRISAYRQHIARSIFRFSTRI